MPTWIRVVLVVLAVLLALNGFNMLFRAEAWYASVPSVPHTGPFNPHFVMDIGCAYLGSAFGLALAVWRPAWWVPAALVSAFFLVAHALVHLAEAIGGHASVDAMEVIDYVGVYAPPLIVIALLIGAPRHAANA
jgi:hypothetical protein